MSENANAYLDGWHICYFCGDLVKEGKDSQGRRHYLSDCRPDLVEHEEGPSCTWFGMPDGNGHTCYAYQERGSNKWGTEHKHFYKDGPM